MSHLAELQEGRQLGKDCSVGFFVVNYVGVPNRWRLQSGLQTVTRLTIKLWLAVCIGHNVFLRIRQSFCLLDSISCILYLLPKFTVCWCFFYLARPQVNAELHVRGLLKWLYWWPLCPPLLFVTLYWSLTICYTLAEFDEFTSHSLWKNLIVQLFHGSRHVVLKAILL